VTSRVNPKISSDDELGSWIWKFAPAHPAVTTIQVEGEESATRLPRELLRKRSNYIPGLLEAVSIKCKKR
jgi:hypothetical protein